MRTPFSSRQMICPRPNSPTSPTYSISCPIRRKASPKLGSTTVRQAAVAIAASTALPFFLESLNRLGQPALKKSPPFLGLHRGSSALRGKDRIRHRISCVAILQVNMRHLVLIAHLLVILTKASFNITTFYKDPLFPSINVKFPFPLSSKMYVRCMFIEKSPHTNWCCLKTVSLGGVVCLQRVKN